MRGDRTENGPRTRAKAREEERRQQRARAAASSSDDEGSGSDDDDGNGGLDMDEYRKFLGQLFPSKFMEEKVGAAERDAEKKKKSKKKKRKLYLNDDEKKFLSAKVNFRTIHAVYNYKIGTKTQRYKWFLEPCVVLFMEHGLHTWRDQLGRLVSSVLTLLVSRSHGFLLVVVLAM